MANVGIGTVTISPVTFPAFEIRQEMFSIGRQLQLHRPRATLPMWSFVGPDGQQGEAVLVAAAKGATSGNRQQGSTCQWSKIKMQAAFNLEYVL